MKLCSTSTRFSTFTGDSAEIQRQPGGSFKLFGGRIEGRNIELAPNQRIVQAWREASWSPGIYSLAKFDLVARSFGTRIVFDQAGIAEKDWEHPPPTRRYKAVVTCAPGTGAPFSSTTLPAITA